MWSLLSGGSSDVGHCEPQRGLVVGILGQVAGRNDRPPVSREETDMQEPMKTKTQEISVLTKTVEGKTSGQGNLAVGTSQWEKCQRRLTQELMAKHHRIKLLILLVSLSVSIFVFLSMLVRSWCSWSRFWLLSDSMFPSLLPPQTCMHIALWVLPPFPCHCPFL